MQVRSRLIPLAVPLLLTLFSIGANGQTWKAGNSVQIAGNDMQTPTWDAPGTPRQFQPNKKPLLSIKTKTDEGGRWVPVPSILLRDAGDITDPAILAKRQTLATQFPWLASWQFSSTYGPPSSTNLTMVEWLQHVRLDEVVNPTTIGYGDFSINPNSDLKVHPETIRRMVDYLVGPNAKHFGLAALHGQNNGRVFHATDHAWVANPYNWGLSPLFRIWLSAENGTRSVGGIPSRFLDVRGAAEAAIMHQAPVGSNPSNVIRNHMSDIEEVGYELSVLIVFIAWEAHLELASNGVLNINTGLDLDEIPANTDVDDINFDIAHGFTASFSLSGTGIDINPLGTSVTDPAPREPELLPNDLNGPLQDVYAVVPHSVGEWVEIGIPVFGGTHEFSSFHHPFGEPGVFVPIPPDYDPAPDRIWIFGDPEGNDSAPVLGNVANSSIQLN